MVSALKALALSLLFLALLATQLPIPASAQTACTSSVCSATVNRTVTTNNWGITFVSDQFSMSLGSSPISEISIGLPSTLASHLRFTQAVDSQSNQLVVSSPSSLKMPSGGNYSSINIAFPSPGEKGAYSFNVTSVYTGLLRFNATGNTFIFAFEPFPLTDGTYAVTSSQVSVKTNDWQSPKTTGINGTFASATFTSQTTTLQPYNATVAQMTFAPGATNQAILDTTANRTITFSQSGAVQVTDFYNMTNNGNTLSTVSIPVPKNVQTADAIDIIGVVGSLPASTTSAGINAVTFTPRFGSIKAASSILVRLSYTLPTSSYLTSKGLGRYELNFHMFDNVMFYEPSLQVRIVKPQGLRLSSISVQNFTSSGNQITVVMSTVTPLSNLSFTMDYQLDPFWASASALGWAGLAAGTIGVIVLAVGATGLTSVSTTGTPTELIGRFVDLYDEKSAMRLEAEKMDEDLSRGALNRHDYKRRRRAIDLKIAELERTIAPDKNELSKSNPRYQDMIRRLDRAEADVQVVRTTTADLTNQYRSGRIQRELYESLTSDLAKRKEKAQQTMDTIVINLREETR